MILPISSYYHYQPNGTQGISILTSEERRCLESDNFKEIRERLLQGENMTQEEVEELEKCAEVEKGETAKATIVAVIIGGIAIGLTVAILAWAIFKD